MQKYDKIMMKTAELWAQQSKCIRNKVGAVIAKDNRIISIGYNGTPSGWKNQKEITCNLCKGKGYFKIDCPDCYGLGHKPRMPIKCSRCGGTGEIDDICPKCGGTGKIKENLDLDCEKEINSIVSKCCHAEIIEDFKENIIICSNCKNEIGFIDLANDNSGNYRIIGEFESKKILKTDHSKVIHAEANAILFAAKEGIPLKNTTIYVTTSPCPECSKMIVQSGIKRVVFKDLYRNTEGLDLLVSCGIQVQQYINENDKECLKNYNST